MHIRRNGEPAAPRRTRRHSPVAAAVCFVAAASSLGACSGSNSGAFSVGDVVIINADDALTAARGTLESFRSINSATTAADSDCWIPILVDNAGAAASPTVDVTVWCGPIATPLDGSGWLKGTEQGPALTTDGGFAYAVTTAQYNVAFTTETPQIADGATILGNGQPPAASVAPGASVPAGWVVVGGMRITNSAELFDNIDQKFNDTITGSPGSAAQSGADCWLADDSQTPNAICGPVRLAGDNDTTPPFVQFPITFEPISDSTVRAQVSTGGFNRAQPGEVLIDRTGNKVEPPTVNPDEPTTPTTEPSSETDDPAVAAITIAPAPATVPWNEPTGANRIKWFAANEAGIDQGGELILERWARTSHVDGNDTSPAIDAAPGFELVAADLSLVTDVLNEQVEIYLDVDGQRTAITQDLAETGFVASVPLSAAVVSVKIDDGSAVQRFDLRSGARVNDGNPAWYRAETDVGLLTFTTTGVIVPIKGGSESWLVTLVTEHAFLSGFNADGEVIDQVSSDLVVVGRWEAGTSDVPIASVEPEIDKSYRLTLADGTQLMPYKVTGGAERFRAYFHVPSSIEAATLTAQVYADWDVINATNATEGSSGSGIQGESSVMELEYGSPAPAD